MQEYQNRFQELNQAIAPSEHLLLQTRQRMENARPWKWIPRVQKAAAVAVCTVLLFTGAVNLSPAFAQAAAKVPIMRELVLAVAFDPSMKAAIEHNYVQLIKQTIEDNGYQMDVEYLVADPRNLTVYYKMDEVTNQNTEGYEDYQFDFNLLAADGSELKCGATWDYPLSEEEKQALNEVKFHFTGEDTLPEQVIVQLIVEKALPFSDVDQKKIEAGRELSGTANAIAHFEEPRPEYKEVARMQIPLSIDQGSLFNVRTIELNRTIELEGQKVIFDKVEIYPTQVRILWHPDEHNTHLIDGMKIALQSREHGRWEGISNGVTGIGMLGEPQQIWLESSWFDYETEYQLAIERYALIPKAQQTVTYDYAANTFTNLPDYARLVEAVPCDTGLFMQFEFQGTDEVVHGEVLRHESVTQSGSGTGHVIFGGMNNEEDEKDGIYWFYNQFIVTGYEDGPIRFEVTWAPPKVLEEPVIVPLELE